MKRKRKDKRRFYKEEMAARPPARMFTGRKGRRGVLDPCRGRRAQRSYEERHLSRLESKTRPGEQKEAGTEEKKPADRKKEKK